MEVPAQWARALFLPVTSVAVPAMVAEHIGLCRVEDNTQAFMGMYNGNQQQLV